MIESPSPISQWRDLKQFCIYLPLLGDLSIEKPQSARHRSEAFFMVNTQIPRIADITGRKSAQDSAADKEWAKAAAEYQFAKERDRQLKQANRELAKLNNKGKKFKPKKPANPSWKRNKYKEVMEKTRSF